MVWRRGCLPAVTCRDLLCLRGAPSHPQEGRELDPPGSDMLARSSGDFRLATAATKGPRGFREAGGVVLGRWGWVRLPVTHRPRAQEVDPREPVRQGPESHGPVGAPSSSCVWAQARGAGTATATDWVGGSNEVGVVAVWSPHVLFEAQWGPPTSRWAAAMPDGARRPERRAWEEPSAPG